MLDGDHADRLTPCPAHRSTHIGRNGGMGMLALLLAGLWLMMWIGRDTPIGRGLHRALVEAPCRWLASISRGQILLVILILAVVVGIIWLFENDGRMLVAMGLPEAMGFATAIDLSALLDLAAVAVIAAGTVRMRAVKGWLATRFTRPASRQRHSRTRRTPRPKPPSANDDDRPAIPLAA